MGFGFAMRCVYYQWTVFEDGSTLVGCVITCVFNGFRLCDAERVLTMHSCVPYNYMHAILD